jgi:SAM-dependent methyltransferase
MQKVVYHSNYEIEESYFWFLARNEILSKIIKDKTTLKSSDNVADIGCGTGGFAKVLQQDLNFNVTCIDTEELAIEYCKKRGLNDLHLGDLKSFLDVKSKKYKAAFMLDVIEHIPDDQEVVNQVYQLLETDGYFIAAVPAFQWLWSKHDEIHMHYRRYNQNNFKKIFINAGFEVQYVSYFNTFLFLPAVFKRFLDKLLKRESDKPVDEVSSLINNLFLKIFKSEKNLLGKIAFPFGLSILLIAKKK